MAELITQKVLTDILDIARFAPSVHNTQPWKVNAQNNQLFVRIDETYRLKDGDPTGRETIISLGIFVEALCIGIEATGLEVDKIYHEDYSARISVKGGSVKTDLLPFLQTRASDRSIYKPATIDKTLLDSMHRVTKDTSVSVRVVTDKNILAAIASLTAKGIRLALSSPGFRQELSQYLVLPGSRKRRGISVRSLYLPFFVGVFQPLFMRLGIGVTKESRTEKRRWLSASAVIVLTAPGDVPCYWFETGRVYLRVSLAVEQAGLSQATSAALVEASDYHEDIEQLLDTSERILAVLRVGRGSKKRHYSPRVNTEDILTSS